MLRLWCMIDRLAVTCYQVNVVSCDLPLGQAIHDHLGMNTPYMGMKQAELLKRDLLFGEYLTDVISEGGTVWNRREGPYGQVCIAATAGYFAYGYIEAVKRSSRHEAYDRTAWLLG